MNGTILAVLVVVGWSVYYGTSCVFWPYANCGRCKGNGKAKAWWGGGFRPCGGCGGAGRRLRIGRRLYNYVHVNRRGTR